MANNQDWVLARFREDSSKNDPPFYSTREFHGRTMIWLSVIGNVGWYHAELKDGVLVGIRSLAQPPPGEHETPKEKAIHNYQFKWISPKQRRKIEAILNGTSSL